MDLVNGNKLVNLPSPISIQPVNPNSRTHTHGYGKHSNFSDSAIWSKAFRKRPQPFRNEVNIPEAVCHNFPVSNKLQQPIQLGSLDRFISFKITDLRRKLDDSFFYSSRSRIRYRKQMTGDVNIPVHEVQQVGWDNDLQLDTYNN